MYTNDRDYSSFKNETIDDQAPLTERGLMATMRGHERSNSLRIDSQVQTQMQQQQTNEPTLNNENEAIFQNDDQPGQQILGSHKPSPKSRPPPITINHLNTHANTNPTPAANITSSIFNGQSTPIHPTSTSQPNQEEELKIEDVGGESFKEDPYDDDDGNENGGYTVGSPTIKTAKKMVESNTQRRILYTSASRTSLINLFIVLSCVIDSEIRWFTRESFEDFFYDQFAHFQFYFLNILRIIQFICVTLTIRYIHRWYMTNIRKLKQRNKLSQSVSFPLRMKIRFITELAICCIHIPPFVDIRMKGYLERQKIDYITIACFLKFYVIVRLMKEKSPLNSNSGRFIGTFTNIEFTDLFYIKTWLKDNPMQAMMMAILTLLFSCSYMVYLAERTFPVDCDDVTGKFSTYFNSLWLIIVTVFTVGYGDLTPQSDLGRAIAIVAALCGLILSATLIGLVHQYLTLNNDEANVLKFIEQHSRIKVYQESALDVIMQAIRIYVLKMQKKRQPKKIQQALEDLDEKINYFRSLRSKGPDKYAAKGALSTIEYQVNIAYSTLKIISEHLSTKKVILLDNSMQAKKFMLEQSMSQYRQERSRQFLRPLSGVQKAVKTIEVETQTDSHEGHQCYCNCHERKQQEEDMRKQSAASSTGAHVGADSNSLYPQFSSQDHLNEAPQIQFGVNDGGQSGNGGGIGQLNEVRELRQIVIQRREEIDRVFSKIKDIEDKMNIFLQEISEI